MDNVIGPPAILKNFIIDKNNIYGNSTINLSQQIEHQLREDVANIEYSDYLLEISKHHSVGVMDHEIKLFCKGIKNNGVIIDVGGCWGWHWRDLHIIRPDLTVVIVDLVRSNLRHANKLLQDRIGKNIFLVHGDATNLQFPNSSFDGFWSVQTLQHIPDLNTAFTEAYRVLKPAGQFATYSLNNAALIRFIYKILGKNYIIKGMVQDQYYLQRADQSQKKQIQTIFNNIVFERFTEILYKPEFHLGLFGRQNSFVGMLDKNLSGNFSFLKPIARQHSFHTQKKIN